MTTYPITVTVTDSSGASATASTSATTSTSTGSIIPADRLATANWQNAGMKSKGGIPNRTTIFTTLLPTGGGADDSGKIQTAVNTCPIGQVVKLAAGNFIVNNLVLVSTGITLRGSGAGVTFLTKTNGARARTATVVAGTTGIKAPTDPGSYTYDAQPIIIVGPGRWVGPDNSTPQNLTVDGVLGATSVTIANATGFAAGQFVLLDELSGATWKSTPPGFLNNGQAGTAGTVKVFAGDRVVWNIHQPNQTYQDDPPDAFGWFCRPTPIGAAPANYTDGRATSEIKEVASVAGNVITFTSPLTLSYRTSHGAQLTRYTATGSASGANSIHVTNAGVESLSTVGGADGQVRFECAAYCWAKNIEVSQWIGEGVAIDNSFRVELRDSYIHTGSWPEPGGAGYAISLAGGSSEVLIENNICIDTCKVIVDRCCGAGSVVAYNYMDDAWDFDTPAWVECGINASHMAGPHHVLFEGNHSFNFDSDYTHGNAIYLTVFRNCLTGKRRDFTDSGINRCGGGAVWSWWLSFVGNILGRSGQMAGWTYTDPGMGCDVNGNNCSGVGPQYGSGSGGIWTIGYDPERWQSSADSQTMATLIRDGNYDFLTNSQRWHNTPATFTIPSSLYLTVKPAFFGSNAWPWTNPSNGTINTLPAKARFDAGTPNTVL